MALQCLALLTAAEARGGDDGGNAQGTAARARVQHSEAVQQVGLLLLRASR